MAEEVSPTVARRRLRLAVREARDHAGKTQQEVAEEMEWSASKVIRIENGDVTIAPNDLRPLLTYLGVTDRAIIAELTAAARVARRRQRKSWYQSPEYREHLTPAMTRQIEYEAEAVAIRSWSVFYVPGPLQTPDYARANLDSFDEDDISEQRRHYRAESRRLRREVILQRLGTLKIYALLDESVFRRTLGVPNVFLGQLQEMHRLASDGLIKVRMVPFDFEASVTNNATFDLISLDEEDEGSEVLYREVGISDEIIEDRVTTRRHHARFDKIWQDANSEDDTIAFMRGRISDLETLIKRRKIPE
jgi:transcriptional regulator with XRE-family HTH domain